MKITTAWAKYEDGQLPTVISAYDEILFDTWGGVPDWYTEEITQAEKDRATVRELTIVILDEAVDNLFKPAITGGIVQ